MGKEQIERDKKTREEEANRKKAIEDEQAKNKEEDNRRAMETQAAQKEGENQKAEAEDTNQVAYKLFEHLDPDKKKAWKKDADELIEEYKKDRKLNDKGAMVFESEAEMLKFFEGQAQQGRKFMCMEVDADGKPTGQYQFSCGDGKLYSGTLQNIQAKLQGNPDSASKDSPTAAGLAMINNIIQPRPQPTVNPQRTKEIKEGLHNTIAAAKREKEEATQVATGSPSPTPLSTQPK